MIASDVISDTVPCLWIDEEGEGGLHLVLQNALVETKASSDENQPEDEAVHEDNCGALNTEGGEELETMPAQLSSGQPDKTD